MSMGGWHHKGANVTAKVVVPEGWMDPAERRMAIFAKEMEKRKKEKEQKSVVSKQQKTE